MSIHWPCYCTVYVHVVNHFCDSMWSFWVEANLCLYMYCSLDDIQLSREEGWDPINRFNPTTFLCLSLVICRGLFCVQWIKMRNDCWHWWNGWPLLFKLSSHNSILTSSMWLKLYHLLLCAYKYINKQKIW